MSFFTPAELNIDRMTITIVLPQREIKASNLFCHFLIFIFK